MKKISRWAKRNPRSAQITIILSFIILNVLGYFIGRSLNDLGVMIPGAVLTGMILLCGIIILMYPKRGTNRNASSKNSEYYKRKTCEGLMATASFMMMICAANDPSVFWFTSTTANAVSHAPVVPHDSLSKKYKSPLAFAASLKNANGERLHGKEKRKLLKEQIRNIKQSEDLSKGAKAGLIALSILIAAGLLYIVMAIACDLSCTGNDAAAVAVLIGGTGLVVILLLLVLHSITRKKKKKEIPGPDEKSTDPKSAGN